MRSARVSERSATSVVSRSRARVRALHRIEALLRRVAVLAQLLQPLAAGPHSVDLLPMSHGAGCPRMASRWARSVSTTLSKRVRRRALGLQALPS